MIILPFEEKNEFVENGRSYSNVLRVKRDLGEASHLGLVATDRRFDSGGSGSLFGVDAQIRLSQSNAFQLQVLGTHTEEVDNPALMDSLFNVTRFDESTVLENINGGVNAAREYNFDDVKKDEWIVANLEVKLRAAQTGVHSRYMISNELFGGVQFDGIWEAHT